MSFKDVLISKIAKEKKETKKLTKKAAWSDAEKKQVGALDDNAVGKYNLYQNMGGEIFVTNHKLNNKYALMDTADDIDTILEKVEEDWQEYANFIGYDKEIANKVWFLKNSEDSNEIVDLTKDYATEKKATVGFFANPETEEEKIAIDLAEEIDARAEYILHRAGLLERGWQTEEQWRERVNVVKEAIKPLVETKLKKYLDQPQVIDLVKEHLEDINSHATVWAIEEIINGKEQNLFNQANKRLNFDKKAAEEDLDVKLKVQKNKPAGLDTSSPKSLPESIRPLMQDLKGKMATLKETEAELADVKAGLDAKYQKAKDESKIVEKQAEIENLTNSIGKLLFAAKNETFQFQDNLVALTHQTKVVPAKATDKWKFEKVFEKLKSLMGDENAQKFLEATLNGLQSQATEKTITELNIFSPTQKQMKQSDTSDTNKFIDALKEIYVNLRSYFLDVKKANNIIEEQLATDATASKKQVVTKKAEYKAEEDVLFEMMEDFEIFTPGEIEVGITVGGRNLETAEAMLFSRTGLRSLTQLKDDLRNTGTDQETLDSYMVGDIEDTEIESKKKVNLKKANVADIRERIKRYKQNKDEKVLNILNKMNEQDLKKTIKEYRRALFDQKETYTPEQEEIRHYLFDIDNQEMTLKQVKENLESKKKVKVGKEAKKEFVDINGKTWKEFLDNIKNEGYTFDEKLYEEKVTTIPKVITVSKGEHSDKVVAYWNDDREEYGISNRMDA